MGRFRSFLRRVARPAAMVGVVGVLSFTMIGAQPAYAADTLTKYRDAKAFEEIIKANYKTIQPVAQTAMVAGSFTPVGAGIRLLQLGMLAYSTSDLWMPWFSGTFGQGSLNDDVAGAQQSGAAAPRYIAGLRLSNSSASAPSGPNAMRIKFTYTGTVSGSSSTFRIATVLQCKKPDGSIVSPDVKGYGQVNFGMQATGHDLEFKCASTSDTAVGLVAGAANAAPELVRADTGVGPENVVRQGTVLTGSGSFDPYSADTKVKVRSECIASDGTKSTVEAESSGDYLRMPSCAAAGKGHGTGKTSIVGLAPGTTTEKPLWDSPAAPSDPATPLCDASRPTDGCTLSVELDGKTCDAGNVECQNWAEVNQNDPNKDTESSRLKCRLGPYKVPMAQCAALEKAYVGGQIWSDANTDGDPSTSGAPSTAPSGSPAAKPAPTTTTPGTTTGTVPGSSGQPAPAPSGSPDAKMANCFPTGWAMFNPVEWVLKPVRCAFEPTQTQTQIQARANGVMQLAQGKAPISFITNLTMTGPSGGGCPNWTINVAGLSENVVCESSFTAAILSVRAPLFGLVATAMVWPLLRSIWYAAIPVLRVTPSSGGK